jgi:hypothetical protein
VRPSSSECLRSSPSHELYLIAAICYLLLFGFVTWEEFRAVI